MHQPKEYEQYKSMSLRDAEIFGPRIVQEVPWGQNEIIVDYGCGAGSTGARFFLPAIQKTDSKMISIDCSSEMIDYAKTSYPDPRIAYFVGDIMKDPTILGIEAVDKIFSVYAFQFIRSHRELFQRLWVSLKPSGYLAFTMITDISALKFYVNLGRHEKWGQYMKGYDSLVSSWLTDDVECNVHQELQKDLVAIGFEVKKLETHKLTYHYESVDILVELCMTVNPFIGNYPSELLPELRQEYRKFVIELHGNKQEMAKQNGECGSKDIPATVQYEIVFAVAKKKKVQQY